MHILVVTWIIMAIILWFERRTGVLRTYRPRVTKRTEAEIRESAGRYHREIHEWEQKMAAKNRRLEEQNRKEREEEYRRMQ